MGSVVQKLDHFCVCNVLAHNSYKASTNCTIPASHHNPFVFFFSLLLPPANIYVSFMLISFTNGFSVTLYFVAVEVCPHSQNLTHTHRDKKYKFELRLFCIISLVLKQLKILFGICIQQNEKYIYVWLSVHSPVCSAHKTP